MDEARSELILKNWKHYRDRWPKGLPVFRVPMVKSLAEMLEAHAASFNEEPTARVDILEFTVERGMFDRVKAWRIMCEGYEVEAGFEEN